MMGKFKKAMFGIIYWAISLTWGALITYPGLLITLFCIIFLKGKPHKNGVTYIVEIGGNWGGLELGATALCGSYSKSQPRFYDHTRAHEFGHNIQQLVLGPLQLFLVQIPSAVRYWYGRLKGLKHPYDYALFEYTASKYGYYWMKRLDNAFQLEYTYKRKQSIDV